MAQPVIRTDRLSKTYHIARTGPIRRRLGPASRSCQLHQALEDISFQVQPGQVVGVIGRNGAGKSTLLKILSRITDPTSGQAWINGKVASLLEVGTGFHPELTGRENIYFNGAILGMTRREIRNRFDEIVSFADVGPFLDTPVKRYSSGMQVRLAFAVAAHLQPEVLLVDEVLAVGDVGFQKKCLGRMQGISQSGRTILFVSHNLTAVQQLCERCLVLDKGRLVADGSVAEGIAAYLGLMRDSESTPVVNCRETPGRRTTNAARIAQVRLLSSPGAPTTQVAFGADFAIDVALEITQPCHDLSIGIGINSLDGVRIFTTESRATCPLERIEPGPHRFRLDWDGLVLRPGLYSIDVGHNSDAGNEFLPGVLQFDILEAADASGRVALDRRPGLVLNTMHWSRCERPETVTLEC